MHFNLVRTISFTCLALIGGKAEAASQGSLGATSTGSIAITLSVAGRVKISGLSDVAFVAVSPDAAALRAQDFCMWSNTATKGYSVTATGSGAGSAFELASASGTAPYSVAWNKAAGQSAGTPLSSGAVLSGLTSAAASPVCSSSGADSSTLIVTIDPAALQNLQPDTTYTGALNLLVSPE